MKSTITIYMNKVYLLLKSGLALKSNALPKVICLFILLLLVSACDNNQNMNTNENTNLETVIDDDVRRLSFGFRDKDGNHVDNGTLLDINTNEFNGSIYFKHEIPEERKYKLIILDNYQQTHFQADNRNETVSYFDFEMEPNSEIDINVNVPINKATQEISLLLIKMPEYQLQEFDLNRASVLEEVLAHRFPIKTNEKPLIEFTEPVYTFTGEPNDNLVASIEKNDLRVSVLEKAESTIYLSAGNIDSPENESIPYAIVAFKDWEQHDVLDGTKVLFTDVPYDTRHVYETNLPSVNEKQNFQYIAFPFPYHVEKENYFSQDVFGTFRILIEP